jgi:hypothetical protein
MRMLGASRVIAGIYLRRLLRGRSKWVALALCALPVVAAIVEAANPPEWGLELA